MWRYVFVLILEGVVRTVRSCPTKPLAVGAVLLALLSSCDSSGRRARAPSSAWDSAGVRIIVNESSDIQLQANRTLALGTVDENGPQLFSQIQRVAIGGEGRLYVANGGSTSVRSFTRDGVFEREYGRRGRGPAELRELNDIVVAPDSLVLIDWQREGRVLLFDRNGTFLWGGTIRGLGSNGYLPIHWYSGGWLWALQLYDLPHPAPGDSIVVYSSIVRRAFESAVEPEERYSIPAITLFGHAAAGAGPAVRLFAGSRDGKLDHSGRYYAPHADRYQIDVYDGPRLVRSIRRNISPHRITAEDVRGVKEAAVAIIDTLSTLPESHRAEQRTHIIRYIDLQVQLGLPQYLGPIERILVSGDGHLWVQRRDNGIPPAVSEAENMYAHTRFPHRPTRWDVWNVRGEYVGTVAIPARYRAEAVAGFTVVGVAADENDVEYVVRYEVQVAR